jgi:pimeloyl-ACP methyl ester carboxylesterase
MYVWFQIILLILLYLAVIFYTLYYNKLFQPTKRIVKFEIEPTEQTIVDGISVARFVFDESRPTILFCHGNSGNVSNRNYMVKLCKMLNQNLILFDYSGYGLSEGEPRTRRIMKDGEKVLEWTLKRVDKKNLIIWGESLGGSIASYLASKNKCSKLVLFATFASLNDLAFNPDMNYFMKAIQMFLNIFVHPLPTKDWLKETQVPTLVVHSEDDELISIEHARRLRKIDPNRVKLLEIKGGHGTPKLLENDLCDILSFCDVGSTEVDHQACLTIFDNVSKEIWTE